MRRVLSDFLRQTRYIWIGPVAVVTIAEVVILRQASPAHSGTLLNYCSLASDLMNVMMVATSMDALRMLRLIFTLPIRRRDVGAGLWLMNVIGPVLLTSMTKLMVVGIAKVFSPDAPVNLRWVAASGLFDFAYAGSLCWLMQQAVRREFATGVRQWLTTVYWTVGTIVLLGGTLALGWYVPTAVSPWNWPIGLVLLGMLCLTVTGYVQSETLVVHGGPLQLLVGKRPTNTGPGVAPGVLAPFGGRLSSPRRMLWEQFRSAAITSVLTISVLMVMGSLPVPRTLGFWENVRQSVPQMPAELGAMLWGLGWILYLGIGVKRWQPSRILVLRTLPISSREINLLLLLRPIVTGFAYWLALLPIFMLAPAGVTAWMGLGSLAALIGLTGLTSAATLRWHRSPLTGLATMAVMYLLLFAHPWKYLQSIPLNAGMVQLVCLVFGIASIVAAYAWHERLLTRSGPLYQRTK